MNKAKHFRYFKSMPPDNVFFETDDAGYYHWEVYAKAAEIRNIAVTELKTQIMNNFGRCFQS